MCVICMCARCVHAVWGLGLAPVSLYGAYVGLIMWAAYVYACVMSVRLSQCAVCGLVLGSMS